MNKIKSIFKYIPFRIWAIVLLVYIVLATVIDVLAFSVFPSLINLVLGGPTPIYAESDGGIYKYSTESTASAYLAANDNNEKFCEAGFVLLKNKDEALPVATPVSDNNAKKKPSVSIFGKNSVNLVYGGSGSSGGSHESAKTIYDSLEEAGYKCNPYLKSFYEDDAKSGTGRSEENSDLDSGDSILLDIGETPYSSYPAEVYSSYSEYADIAVVVLSRMGGEGFDLPKSQLVNGQVNEDRHYLEPDENELLLLEEVCNFGFDKVVVIINSSSVMELNIVEDNDNIDACIWVGAPGDTGIMALGRIMNGEVNPSGHNADTYARDFTANPAYVNFADETNKYDRKSSWGDGETYFTDYEEGIYVGYRYYETRGAQDEVWYDENVLYPFGYGLSYTSFAQEIANRSEIEKLSVGTESFTVEVIVTNTGTRSGKDAVELYITPTYTAGGIEKSAKILVGLAKTKTLRPGESQSIEISVEPYNFASYDYNDANGNGFSGYELEKGDYTLTLGETAHDAFETLQFRIASDISYETDPETDAAVVNRFGDADDRLQSILSRSDWDGTFPQAATESDKTADDALMDAVNNDSHNNPNQYTVVPVQGEVYVPTQEELDGTVESRQVVLKMLSGKDYNDEMWEELLNQITVEEMANLCNKGAFTTEPITSIGKYTTVSADGPTGFTVFMGGEDLVGKSCAYCCEVIIACSWDPDIAYQQGLSIGEEGLWGNTEKGKYTYSGIYAPGVNIHRSPFGGRNGEYYSEDSYVSGILAANVIKGCAEKGVVTYMKHFAVNEQETKRMGVLTWIDEQTLREIYLKPFEIAVKESDGACKGIMSSFNRIGARWTGGDYRLLTEVLRGEWKFQGTVISDFNTNKYMNIKQMFYAGGDLNLATNRFWSAASRATSAQDITVLRNATHNILYSIANSNAFNAEIIGEKPPVWMVTVVIVESVIGVGLIVWGIFILFSVNRRKEI